MWYGVLSVLTMINPPMDIGMWCGADVIASESCVVLTRRRFRRRGDDESGCKRDFGCRGDVQRYAASNAALG